jgi:lipoprotein-anchoring transpeptidase ErfK/SrfK
MGLSADGVGIHGTPDSASIGYSASHGCIRMYVPDAEWLFNRVEVGTQVFVVSA